MSFKSLVITFIFFAGMSAAQENPNLCLSLVGDAERLECYDKYFKAQLQDERGEDAADPEIGTEIYKYERAKEFCVEIRSPRITHLRSEIQFDRRPKKSANLRK